MTTQNINTSSESTVQTETTSGRHHPAVVVEFGELREEIDVKIAPLILEIWKAGIQTMMSCQETNPGFAWIEFDSPEDLLRFLNLVTEHEVGIDVLYNRVNPQLRGDQSLPSWEFLVNFLDLCEDTEEQADFGIVDFEMTIGAYFPHADIPILLARLQSFNRLAASRENSD